MKDKFTETELNLALNFMDQIPFNQYLGLKVHSFDADVAIFKLAMRPELVGNWLQGILHGGVISSALDVAGGTAALAAAYQQRLDLPVEERNKSLAKLGTIDLRVDYLRPGRGEEFYASATILRIGSKVAVTRMEFKNEKDELLAVGTGTYMCG
ncbi:thioesterase family protein [Oceaniserpentilla sp. 4NH20-0058]|uniref:thioesterase family protein n=1 Tax=Oceaniserpentilla sp. 4NH20-0058 TaxID=3127660 RepID=UPI003106FFC4